MYYLQINKLDGLTYKDWKLDGDLEGFSERKSGWQTFTYAVKSETLGKTISGLEATVDVTKMDPYDVSYTIGGTPLSDPIDERLTEGVKIRSDITGEANIRAAIAEVINDCIRTGDLSFEEVDASKVTLKDASTVTVELTASTAASAKFDNVEISGKVKEGFSNGSFKITLKNDKFNEIAIGTDVASWFSSLPDGLTATVIQKVDKDATDVTITIAGEPTTAATTEATLTIPANVLAKATAVKATGSVKFIFAETKYQVSVGGTKAGTGTITVIAGQYVPGATVKVVVEPADGYVLEELYYVETGVANGEKIGITKTNGVYSFAMPAMAVTVWGTFEEVVDPSATAKAALEAAIETLSEKLEAYTTGTEESAKETAFGELKSALENANEAADAYKAFIEGTDEEKAEAVSAIDTGDVIGAATKVMADTTLETSTLGWDIKTSGKSVEYSGAGAVTLSDVKAAIKTVNPGAKYKIVLDSAETTGLDTEGYEGLKEVTELSAGSYKIVVMAADGKTFDVYTLTMS